jgi:hypothetical protein
MLRTFDFRGLGAERAAKWARAAVVSAALAAVGLGGCDTGEEYQLGGVTHIAAAVPDTFVARRARDVGVTIKTPPTWKETSTAGSVVLNLLTDEPGSSVNLVAMPARAGETLDKTMAELPGQLSREFANFEHVGTDFVIVNDLPAGRIVYEATRAGFDGKLMQVVITRAKTHYILTYTASPDRYEAEYPTVEQVLASLEVH